jgi:hypothetical protein
LRRQLSFNDDRLLSFDGKDFGQMCGHPSRGGGTLADAIAPLTERLPARSLPARGRAGVRAKLWSCYQSRQALLYAAFASIE